MAAAKKSKIKQIPNFSFIILSALAKGDATTNDLKRILPDGTLDQNPIAAACDFWENLNELVKSGDITSDKPLPGPDQQFFINVSVTHSITKKGRETLQRLRTGKFKVDFPMRTAFSGMPAWILARGRNANGQVLG
jgi:hypothetical protein